MDREAGLPAGTTSRYARTRDALLEVASRALLDADRAEALAEGDEPLALLTTATERLLAASDRYRARVELQLESSRSATLEEHLRESRAGFCRTLSERLGVSMAQADILIVVVDGILHRQILLGRPPLSDTEIRELFAAVLG